MDYSLLSLPGKIAETDQAAVDGDSAIQARLDLRDD